MVGDEGVIHARAAAGEVGGRHSLYEGGGVVGAVAGEAHAGHGEGHGTRASDANGAIGVRQVAPTRVEGVQLGILALGDVVAIGLGAAIGLDAASNEVDRLGLGDGEVDEALVGDLVSVLGDLGEGLVAVEDLGELGGLLGAHAVGDALVVGVDLLLLGLGLLLAVAAAALDAAADAKDKGDE